MPTTSSALSPRAVFGRSCDGDDEHSGNSNHGKEPQNARRNFQRIAFGVDQLSLSDSIDWVAANALKLEAVVLEVKGGSGDEKAVRWRR